MACPLQTAEGMEIPQAPGLDNTFALMRDPYMFIGRTCRDLNSDCFRTRLLGRTAYCFGGSDAAQFFTTQPTR